MINLDCDSRIFFMKKNNFLLYRIFEKFNTRLKLGIYFTPTTHNKNYNSVLENQVIFSSTQWSDFLNGHPNINVSITLYGIKKIFKEYLTHSNLINFDNLSSYLLK